MQSHLIFLDGRWIQYSAASSTEPIVGIWYISKDLSEISCESKNCILLSLRQKTKLTFKIISHIFNEFSQTTCHFLTWLS